MSTHSASAARSMDRLLDLSKLADRLASRLANQNTHPALWSIYRRNLHEELIEQMQDQPLPEVVGG